MNDEWKAFIFTIIGALMIIGLIAVYYKYFNCEAPCKSEITVGEKHD